MTDTYIQDVVMAGHLMETIREAGGTVRVLSGNQESNGDYSSFVVEYRGGKYRVKVTTEQEVEG